MLDFRDARITELVVHIVGNKLRQEGILKSEKPTKVQDESIQQILHSYFLKPFLKTEFAYNFSHSVDLRLNESFHYSESIFNNETVFLKESHNFAKHLYEQSTHPKIQSGEFFVALIKGTKINDVGVDAIGLFKTEYKDTYLKVNKDQSGYEIGYEVGINVNRLDKGCLIFNRDVEKGLYVTVTDTRSKAEGEAKFWRDKFLCVKPLHSDSSLTKQHISLGSQLLKSSNTPDRSKALELQNRVIDYFETNDEFEINTFSRNVIGDDPDLRYKFNLLRDDLYGDEHPASFSISHDQVGKFKQRVRNLIHLDSNIDIVIRGGGTEDVLHRIERGYDQKHSKNYYKIYFDTES